MNFGAITNWCVETTQFLEHHGPRACIPYHIHGDEGRGQLKRPYMVVSWQCVISHHGPQVCNESSFLISTFCNIFFCWYGFIVWKKNKLHDSKWVIPTTINAKAYLHHTFPFQRYVKPSLLQRLDLLGELAKQGMENPITLNHPRRVSLRF